MTPILRPLICGLLLLIAAPALASAQRPSQAAVDAAIAKGVKHLAEKGVPQLDEQRSGMRALAAYALVKSGVDPHDPQLASLFTRLSFEYEHATYDSACVILATAAHDPEGHADLIESLARGLVSRQNDAGDWGYPGGADLSNTQYAALGLWAATRAGFEIDDEVWTNLAKGVLRYRRGDGGFGYRVGDSGTGSMTCAGVGTLAICRSMLGTLKGRRAALGKQIDSGIESGLGWLDRHWSVTQNPGRGGGHHYYYLYGLERVGGLAGVQQIGEHDWYGEGAKVILSQQRANGSWGNTNTTAFALLFLRRATAPTTGPAAARVDRYVTRAGVGPVRLVAKGDTPIDFWLADWNEKALGNLVREGEAGRGPRVLRVDYLAGEQVLGSVAGAGSGPAGDERFAHRHFFRAPGEYAVRARIELLGPRTTGPDGRPRAGEVVVVETAVLTLTVDEVVPEWLADQADDPEFNLMPIGAVEAGASSAWEGGTGVPAITFAAAFAVDGRLGRPWLADPTDEKPKLTLRLRKPVKADVILISGPRSTPHREGYFARPLEVEISINGGEPRSVRMHVDERRKGRLQLPNRVPIRRLEISIPWQVPGEVAPATGLGEVELQDSGDRK